MKTKLININYLIGAIIGLTFPDFDFFLIDYIGHRSFITHSIFIFLIFFTLSKKNQDLKKLNFLLGMCFGLIVHLISDMDLPAQFIDLKTIKIFSYDLGKYSFFWILINILLAFYFLEKLFKLLELNRKKYHLINLFIGAVFIYLNSENYIVLTFMLVFISLFFQLLFKRLI